MAELPYTDSNYGGLYTIEEHEQFFAGLIDHNNDFKVTAVTSMIDQAAHDVAMGLDYLHHNYS